MSRHLVEPSPSAFYVRAGKRAEELVTSVADDKVVRPQTGSEGHRHVAEQLIACRVAVDVVGRLETVDIDEGENESPIRAAGSVQLMLEVGHAAVAPLRRSVTPLGRLITPLGAQLALVDPRSVHSPCRSSRPL